MDWSSQGAYTDIYMQQDRECVHSRFPSHLHQCVSTLTNAHKVVRSRASVMYEMMDIGRHANHDTHAHKL